MKKELEVLMARLAQTEAALERSRSAIREFLLSCKLAGDNYVGGIERLKLEAVIEEHHASCSHYFQDTRHCLKCGWIPD